MAKTGKGLPRSLENTDFSSVVPEATAETAGLVKKGAAVTNIGSPSALTLTVTVTGGLAPYTYQWYKNNNAIAGATAATYTKATTVASADSGTYKVVVHDVYGNIISSSTVATVS